MKRGALLLVALLALGCGSKAYQGALITATNADQQFVQTTALYNQLCPVGKLTPTQCDAWKAFMPRYQTISDQAYKALKAGRDVQNADQVVALVTNLVTELTLYYGLGVAAGGK